MSFKNFFIGVIFSFIIISCSKNINHNNSNSDLVKIKINRFEKELFSLDPSRIEDSIGNLSKKYSDFFLLFNYRIINIGDCKDELYPELLRRFVTDYTNFRAYEKVMTVFDNLDSLTAQFQKGFTLYKKNFPEKKIPRIITYTAGFNQSVVSDEGILGIGLDKYLGVNEEMYKELGIYSYMIRNMHKHKIISDCMLLWANTEFEYNDSINNLICKIINEGRSYFFLDKILPDQPDSLKWGFSAKQLEFCKNNEKQMWKYLIENKLIFSTDKFTIDKYIREGPFTKDFTSESPARAAVWIGYNIVKSYMNKNKDVTFAKLMYENNYMKILNQSHYNP